ncbi:hypothetical protein D3C72_1923200 [compost metagenome]
MKPAWMRVFCWCSARMKAWSDIRWRSASSGAVPAAMAARYSGVSRTKACTSGRLAAQPARGAQAALAMACSRLPCCTTACVAMACRRASMVVRTTSPSA